MPGQHGKEFFTNTQKSSETRQFLWALVVIISAELLVVGTVVYILLPKGWLLFLLIAVVLSLCIFILNAIRLLLQSAHILTDKELYLRLGPRAKYRIPLSYISGAKAVSLASPPKADMIGISVLREGDRLYSLSRKSDVIRLVLSKQVMVKAPSAGAYRGKQGLVKEILINADEPERFLEKLAEATGLSEEFNQAAFDNSNISGLTKEEIPLELPVAPKTKEADSSPSLEIKHLSKYYGDYLAVQDLSLKVFPGEIFGFLGANGAGKTTTIRMMTGLLRPVAGTVLVQGNDLWRSGTAIRRRIGYIPDTPLIYERLTARELLTVAGRLYSLPEDATKERINELLSILDLQAWSDHMIVTYSMGMQRKVSVALALLPDPDIIVVDELTNAFDAPTLAEIKDILLNLKNQGKTIFLSTHVMDVAEKLCDRVGIIRQGRLVALGTVNELCKSLDVDGGLEPLFLKLVTTRPGKKQVIC